MAEGAPVSPSADGDRTLARTAGLGAALVFVVVAASAWLRLAAGDAGCPPGGCESFGLPDAVRLAHRVAAMGVAVIALLIVMLAWRAPARAGRRVASLAILVLVGVLSVVGRASAGNPPAGVVLANLAGGLLLLALVTGVACDARAR
jgi:heme A synthase